MLPVIVERDRPMTFREWNPGDTLMEGPFGTSEPGSEAPEAIPDILIVPLLAFDHRGYRLGYGGGYYDRTLRLLRRRDRGCLAVGFAYSGQQVPAVPADDTDERLDWIVHENLAGAFP